MSDLKRLIEFFRLVGQSKKFKRTGWMTVLGMKNPESIADHSYRTAIIAMVLADKKKMEGEDLDVDKIIKMALLHDIHESIMGDWDLKNRREEGEDTYDETERKSIRDILSFLPETLRYNYLEIWEELMEGDTVEAKLVEDADKVELAFQTVEYEADGADKKKLEEFWDFTENVLKDDEVMEMFQMLKKER